MQPSISVIILNYNGRKWLKHCIHSVLDQTIGSEIEIIVADNLSSDGSDRLAEVLLSGAPNGQFIQNGANLGYCEGNNRAARRASGEYLFFLNNDAWLEPDCLEILLRETRHAAASAATPYVMDWSDNQEQWFYAGGFDLFGLPSFNHSPRETSEVFMPAGCSYLIQRELFTRLGEFDPHLFMYADELDLSWRVWISGHSAVVVPTARLHHRGAVEVNPAGGERVVEFRTSETKRYYANRNCLLVLLKNSENILLLLIPLQIFLLLVEATAALVLIRRWSFIRKS